MLSDNGMLSDILATETSHEKAQNFREHISGDGVIPASGEDDFPCADWTAPYRTPASRDGAGLQDAAIA